MEINKKKVIVVLPAYNEADNIGKLLDKIDEAMNEAAIPFMVIIVNDGSTDNTVAIVHARSSRMNIVLQEHATNLGLGPTIRDGLFTAVSHADSKDIIVTMDADDTHTPGLILRMVRMISEGFDVVIASRYQPGSRIIGVPLLRRLLSHGASWLFRIVFPTQGLKDFTSGFRAYRADIIRGALAEYGLKFIDQDGFQCMVDILLKLRRKPIIIGEVPFILRYDFKAGSTKMNVQRTIFNTLKLMIRRRLE